MKRRLSEQELKICRKSLINLKEELEYNEHQVKVCEVNLDKGLEVEFKKKVRDYKKLLSEFKSEVSNIKLRMNILTDQMRNGVEVKENKKEDKNE